MKLNNTVIAIVSASLTGIVAFTALSLGTAYASTTSHDIYIGLATSSARVTSLGWHTPGKSLDFTNNAGETVGANVYAQTRKISGDDMKAYKATYTSPNDCTGVKAMYKTLGGVKLGETSYVHIVVSGSIPVWWLMDTGWTLTLVGSVSGNQPGTCGWTGAHLHQSEAVATGAGKYNSGISANTNYPTSSTWLHHLID